MQNFEQKKGHRHTQDLSHGSRCSIKERIFAATNGSPNSTAVASSLSVCSSCDRHSSAISLQADEIQQLHTRLPNQNLNALENIYRGKESTLSKTHKHTHAHTPAWKTAFNQPPEVMTGSCDPQCADRKRETARLQVEMRETEKRRRKKTCLALVIFTNGNKPRWMKPVAALVTVLNQWLCHQRPSVQ